MDGDGWVALAWMVTGLVIGRPVWANECIVGDDVHARGDDGWGWAGRPTVTTPFIICL